MKIKFAILIALFLLYPVNLQARQPGDFLVRNYSVDLVVYDLDEAFSQLDAIPGISMHHFINIQSGFGHLDYRVAIEDLEEAFYILEGVGEVVRNNSHANNVFSQVTDLETQLQVREAEYHRMLELLHEVEEIDDFYFVESRLSNVIWNMDRIVGQLGTFELETSTARINIFIYTEDTVPLIEPITGFARISGAFVNSAGFSLSMVQWIVLIIAYVSVPMAGLAAAGFCAWKIAARRKRKEVVQIENAE